MPQKSYTLGNLLQDCLDCDIRKSDIRQFFDDLKKKAHFVYAILCGAPKSVFWITLDDEESHPDEKTFSVAEFNDNYENFDSRIDSFRVNFNAYFFREQWATKFPEWELMENPFNGAPAQVLSTFIRIHRTGGTSNGIIKFSPDTRATSSSSEEC